MKIIILIILCFLFTACGPGVLRHKDFFCVDGCPFPMKTCDKTAVDQDNYYINTRCVGAYNIRTGGQDDRAGA